MTHARDIDARVEQEEVRNRALRRADWRFLLPNPYPDVTVCFAEGELRDAVERISGSMADPAGDAACDLVVAVDPDANALHRAFARLRPAGSCYAEWTGLFATADRAGEALRNAGFDGVHLYWAWPSVQRCHVWLPLDEPAAAAHYFAREVRAAHGVARSLVRRARHATAEMRRRLGLTLHVSAIGTKRRAVLLPGANRVDGRPILSDIRRRWSEWGLGPTPKQLSCLMQTGGRRSINKVVTFVFADGERDPKLVIKTARVAEAAEALVREAATLEWVQVSSASGMPGIPRLLWSTRDPGPVAVCETTLWGSPISVSLARKRYEALARNATAWLADFGVASRRPIPPECWTSSTSGLLNDVGRICGSAESTVLAGIADVCSRCDPPPGACEHRDFSPWNVLIDDRDRLSVLDWESSEVHGFTGLDLIYFLSQLAFYRDGLLGSRFARSSIASFRGSYRAAWDPDTLTGAVNHACLAEYGERVGIEPEMFPALRLLTWLVHARSDHRLNADEATTTNPREALRRNLFLNLLQEESGLAVKVAPLS